MNTMLAVTLMIVVVWLPEDLNVDHRHACLAFTPPLPLKNSVLLGFWQTHTLIHTLDAIFSEMFKSCGVQYLKGLQLLCVNTFLDNRENNNFHNQSRDHFCLIIEF